MLNILLIILIILFFDMLYWMYWCNPLFFTDIFTDHTFSPLWDWTFFAAFHTAAETHVILMVEPQKTSRQVSVDHWPSWDFTKNKCWACYENKESWEPNTYIYMNYIDDTNKYGRWMALITSKNCGFMWFHRSTRRNGGRSSLTSPRHMG